NEQITLSLPDGSQSMPLHALATQLLLRGVTLIAISDENGRSYPLYKLSDINMPITVSSILGISISPNALFSETLFSIKHPHAALEKNRSTLSLDLHAAQKKKTLKLLITGWVGSLPLLLQRLLDDFEHIELTLIDDLSEAECADELDYLRRKIATTAGANERIAVEVVRWDFADMNFLRPYVQQADKILLSRAPHLKAHPYASIASVLSHLISIINAQGGSPDIFPILENRHQAMLLQEELHRFNLPHEIHIIIPNAFYGTYVAHTSYHMYSAENREAYKLQRTLRHAISDMMSDVGKAGDMDIQTLHVSTTLPADAEHIFAQLLADGYIWIGYSLKDSFVWNDPLQNTIRKLFPREQDYSCLRQQKIIINPFGNPVSRYSWLKFRENITELIVITAK
ncbi:MAG: hypothetical protein JKY87_02005, partial [Mariprofundus sp.]|nr:hypothetical protein [Mariprofundus sp.]